MARRLGIGHGEDRDQVGDRAVGDEPLRTADPVAVAVADGAGPRRGRVGPGLGLGQGEADQPLPGRQPRDPAGLLLGVAGEQDRQRAELVGRQDQPGRRARAAELLDRQADRQEIAAEPAVLLGERQRQDVLGGQQLAEVLRELAGSIDLGGARRDLLVGQDPDRLAQQRLVLGQSVGRGGGSVHHSTGSRRSAGAAAIRAASTSLMSMRGDRAPAAVRRQPVADHDHAERARRGDGVGTGREHLAAPLAVDPRAARLLHPHPAAAGAAAERVLARLRHLGDRRRPRRRGRPAGAATTLL